MKVERPEVVRDLIESTTDTFGVVIGPSGTGKTYATRAACREGNPSWILYHEIYEPKLAAEELAKTAGMKINPNMID